MKNDPKRRTKVTQSKRGSALAVGGALLIITVVTGLLYGRIALSAGPSPKTPLTVSTTEFVPQTQYMRQASYLGLVVSEKKARLGFEIPGLLATLPQRQGSPVKAGDIVATLDDATLQARRRATAADLDQAHAELELAQLKSRRQKELSASGAVSKEAFDETRLRARALQSQVEATTARLEGIDIQLQKSKLVAPYDGIIADRYMHPGAVVSPGTPVVRLLQSGEREAHIGVSASRSADLVVGQRYSLKLRDSTMDAQLLSVRPDVDPITRAATAVFTLPPETAALDGEPVNLLLQEAVEMSGGWLPMSALLEGRRGVWTVLRIEQQDDQHITLREVVEVLDVQGNKVYVRGSLPPNSMVVSDGLHRITPGNPVLLAEQH